MHLLTQVFPAAGGCFLCLHHPVCWTSMGCHHGPHGGILHQQNPLDPLWPPDALVRAAGSSLHSLPAVSQLSQSALGISGMRQDVLTPWLTQVRCQELQNPPRCHQQLGGLNFVPVALACPSLGLADLDVTAPASSNVLATMDGLCLWWLVAARGDGITRAGRRAGGVCG